MVRRHVSCLLAVACCRRKVEIRNFLLCKRTPLSSRHIYQIDQFSMEGPNGRITIDTEFDEYADLLRFCFAATQCRRASALLVIGSMSYC
jgi:hypothetical protein